jgi:uncharacterized protein YjgD (DUF1641 family)
MAHALTFKPAPLDPHLELMKRLDAAPREHAEALLVAWDLLQTAHDQGILDLAQGLIGGKDIIAGKLAEAANLPESLAAIRNGIALARVLAALDPDMLQRLAKGLDEQAHETAEREKIAASHGTKAAAAAMHKKKAEDKPPSLWQIMKMAISEDARRGLGFGLKLLTALGKATHDGKATRE